MAAQKIGSMFATECILAGIDMHGVSWDPATGSFTFAASVALATRERIAAIYAAHDPGATTLRPTPPPAPPPEPEPTRWQVSRYTILGRLVQAGLADTFFTVLDRAPRLQREFWAATTLIWNDDMGVRVLLDQVGADADAILAVDTSVGQAPAKPTTLVKPPAMGTTVPPGTAPPPPTPPPTKPSNRPQIARSRR